MNQIEINVIDGNPVQNSSPILRGDWNKEGNCYFRMQIAIIAQI